MTIKKRIVLKIGEVEVFKDWVTMRNDFDEGALRYLLRQELKRVLLNHRGE